MSSHSAIVYLVYRIVSAVKRMLVWSPRVGRASLRFSRYQVCSLWALLQSCAYMCKKICENAESRDCFLSELAIFCFFFLHLYFRLLRLLLLSPI